VNEELLKGDAKKEEAGPKAGVPEKTEPAAKDAPAPPKAETPVKAPEAAAKK